ncbi:MAG TPA: EMC3/TMCO1 family protein, partial [Nitrososphaeraceae archaeon]|nr:EMC3/TMCO1 family protein [Nitrososphaeraceae archaeon]
MKQLTATIVAAIITIGLNFAMAILRKKTTDIEKMNKIMKETNEWLKEYTNAIKKHDKSQIEELKKKQAYVNKMTMEMQQQQMRPMLIYMMPS